MRRIIGLAGAASLLALTGCAETGLGGGTAQSISQSDRSQGQQAHPQLLAQYGGLYQGPQANYVTQVGRRIAVQSGLADTQAAFTISLLNSPVNNAFAIPGGYVYITRQLVALTNDEAELASVLGHEVGHVAARHSSRRSTTSTLGSLLSMGLGALTGSSELAEVAGYGAQLYTLKFSRDQEYQADDLGIRYLASAGYDPQGAADMLASLNAQSTLDARLRGQDASALPTWASTHPNTADRVTRARTKARETAATGGVRNRDAFLAAVDGMLYDDDPKQGIVEGRTFSHPGLRLRFTAPQGYAITNGASAVSVTGSGGQAEFSSGGGSGGLAAYIDAAFQKIAGNQGSITHGGVRTTRVNGIEAAYATAAATTQQGRLDVTVFAYAIPGAGNHHFMILTPQGSGLGPFTSLVQSVTPLSAAQAAEVRPRRLDVVTVGARDTIDSLAARMAYSDNRRERFMVLNALDSGARLTPGQKVKLVVYGR